MNEKDFTDILQIEGVNAKGYGIIPKLVMQDHRLTIESKGIYSYFCSYAGAGTQAFPSVPRILADLDISEKRYYKHFGLLKEYGYIKTEQIKQEGKFSHTIYTLCTHPTPSSRFDGTEESPSSRFACTQIESTQNGGTNNNNLLKITDLKLTDKKQQQEPVVVDYENSIKGELKKMGITGKESEVNKWLHTYGSNYVIEKIAIVQKQGSATPLKTLRAAIRDNWLVNIEPSKKNDSKADSERLNGIVSVQSGKYERFYQLFDQVKTKTGH